MSLNGKVAIVTGSARGLGLAFAEAVLEAGGRVAVSDVLEEEGREAVQGMERRFGKGKVHWFRCDVTSESDWDRLWESTEEALGKVDILVNNAGILYQRGWRKCVEVCLLGSMAGTDLAFKKMGQRGGHIINIASAAGLFPAPNLDWNCYFTSKAGVVQMSRSLGGKMVQAATGGQVRVDCICPSFADTKMVTGDKGVHDTANKFVGSLIPVSQVVDAFMGLVTTDGSGRVRVVLSDLPHIHLPPTGHLVTWLGVGAALAKRVRPDIREFTPTMVVGWFIICQLLIYLFLRLFFSLVF